MNIKKIVKKIDDFFNLPQKKQIKKNKKIDSIREKLINKKESLEKSLKKVKKCKEKEELKLQIKAIKNLIKKATIV